MLDFIKDARVQKAFHFDRKMIEWADTLVLVLPAGKSAHLEAGYAKGLGKKLYIIGDFPPGEFDVMYGFADALIKTDEIDAWLQEIGESNNHEMNPKKYRCHICDQEKSFHAIHHSQQTKSGRKIHICRYCYNDPANWIEKLMIDLNNYQHST
jgi:hypothetical protein